MKTIELKLSGRKYIFKADESAENVEEVAELVRRKIESLRKEKPALTLQNAALLAAFDFASQTIKSKKDTQAFKSAILTKTQELLEKVESRIQTLN